MKLTQEDKDYLKQIGNTDKDINQIEYAANHTKYTGNKSRHVTRDDAIDILGRTLWLSGLSRSAFHMTAVRQKDGLPPGEPIRFNSSALWR